MKIRSAVFLLSALLVYLSPAAFAQEKFGDWVVSAPNGEDFIFAATGNESGRVLAHSCDFRTGDCMWTLTMNMECEQDHVFAILTNVDQGAEHLSLMCIGPNREPNQYTYAFTDFEQIDHIIRNSGKISFAIPLESGEFQVSRFNIKGASAAVAKIEEIVTKRSKAPASLKNTNGRNL